MPKLTADAWSWDRIRKLATVDSNVSTGPAALRALMAELHPGTGNYATCDAGELYGAAFGALAYLVASHLREADPSASAEDYDRGWAAGREDVLRETGPGRHDEYRRGRDAGYAEGHHDGREQAENECEHEHTNV